MEWFSGSGFRVQISRFRVKGHDPGFRVSSFKNTNQGSGFRVERSRLRVLGFEFRGHGSPSGGASLSSDSTLALASPPPPSSPVPLALPPPSPPPPFAALARPDALWGLRSKMFRI